MSYRNWMSLSLVLVGLQGVGLQSVGLQSVGLQGALQAADLEFVSSVTLPWAVVDRTYRPPPLEVRTPGTCGTGGLGFRVMSGRLPPGVLLSPAGYFSGIPSRAGLYTFTVRVMNGCAWSQQPFSLTVALPPVILATPSRVVLSWPAGGHSPASVLKIASSWPHQAYAVRVLGDWLEATSERGTTVSSEGTVFEDEVNLRVRLNERTEGTYSAVVELTSWQMEPLRVPVEMVIGVPKIDP